MEALLASAHPMLWWLFALAAVSVAMATIWRTWLGPAVNGIQDLRTAVKQIARVAMALEPYVPSIIKSVTEHPEILQRHEVEIAELQEWRKSTGGGQ